MKTIESNADTRLRIMHVGPFHDLTVALGIRRRGWRALLLAVACWCLPLLLALFAGDVALRSFLHDWGGWAKFLVAPILLSLAEQPIGFAIDECIAILFRVPLFASTSVDDAHSALAKARERSASWSPEAVCVGIAAVVSVANLSLFSAGSAPAWMDEANGYLSPAGIWCLIFSNTVYWFLLTRLVWKHLVWAALLFSFSRCRLRLAIAHPDHHGGLAFMGYYPAGYALFVLAVSSVVAAGMGHVMERQAVTPGLFTAASAAWMAVVVAYFSLPLAGMAARVARLKRKALLLSLAKATDFERRKERLALGDTLFDDPSEDLADPTDVRPVYDAALKTSVMIINKGNLLPIIVPALLPLLAVGAFFLPYAQLGSMAKRLLLL